MLTRARRRTCRLGRRTLGQKGRGGGGRGWRREGPWREDRRSWVVPWWRNESESQWNILVLDVVLLRLLTERRRVFVVCVCGAVMGSFVLQLKP